MREIASGCFGISANEAGVRFERMPQNLAEFYRQQEASRIRLECPSSVRLRFVTDSPSVRLNLRYGAAARSFYQGVVLCESGEAAAFGPAEACSQWFGEIGLSSKGGGERRYDIWLPHLVGVEVVSLEFDNGCSFGAVPRSKFMWLAAGDSITQGMTVPLPTESWVARTALSLGVDVSNWGIGGAKMAPNIGEALKECSYGLLTLAYGTNDFNGNVPPDTYAENARKVISYHAALHPDVPVLLITPIPWSGRTEPNALGATLEDYRVAIAAVGREFSCCRIIEGPSLIADDPCLFVDNVHPNIAGMARYAGNLEREIRAVVPGLA